MNPIDSYLDYQESVIQSYKSKNMEEDQYKSFRDESFTRFNEPVKDIDNWIPVKVLLCHYLQLSDPNFHY